MSAESAGPYLILVAFWQETDDTAAIAEAVSSKRFPPPEGWPLGAVVAFRREVATGSQFLRDLRRFDLAECDPNNDPRPSLSDD